jgi:hypothetical protein
MTAYDIYARLVADFGVVVTDKERLAKGFITNLMLAGIDSSKVYEICFDIINQHIVKGSSDEIHCYACHFKHKRDFASCVCKSTVFRS